MSRNDARPMGRRSATEPDEVELMEQLEEIVRDAPVITDDDPAEDVRLRREVRRAIKRQK